MPACPAVRLRRGFAFVNLGLPGIIDNRARVTESVDVAGLKPAAARCTGSSPVPRTRAGCLASQSLAGIAARSVGGPGRQAASFSVWVATAATPGQMVRAHPFGRFAGRCNSGVPRWRSRSWPCPAAIDTGKRRAGGTAYRPIRPGRPNQTQSDPVKPGPSGQSRSGKFSHADRASGSIQRCAARCSPSGEPVLSSRVLSGLAAADRSVAGQVLPRPSSFST